MTSGGAEAAVRRVLVVDDEVAMAEAIAIRLRAEGFEVHLAHDGPDAVECCESLVPDLVVLDLMLPGFDGIEVCRRIQATRRVPVIMLTARGEDTDVVIGLGVGADDYVVKPFSPRQLVARVHAVLRRVAAGDAARGSGVPDVAGGVEEVETLARGEVRIEVGSRLATVGGEQVHLTATEFDLACCFLRRPRLVFTRAQLLSQVWGYDDPYGERTVDSHVQALRRKLGAGFVRTVHGVGYGLGEREGAEGPHAPGPGPEVSE